MFEAIGGMRANGHQMLLRKEGHTNTHTHTHTDISEEKGNEGGREGKRERESAKERTSIILYRERKKHQRDSVYLRLCACVCVCVGCTYVVCVC